MQDNSKYLVGLKKLQEELQQLISEQESQSVTDGVSGQPESGYQKPTEKQVLDDPLRKAYDASVTKRTGLIERLFGAIKK